MEDQDRQGSRHVTNHGVADPEKSPRERADRQGQDDGEIIRLDGLIGFAEEHHAKW